MKLSQTNKKRIAIKISLLLLLGLISWLTFESSNIAIADNPEQNKKFDGPLLCSCWQGGTFLGYGCGFRCSRDGTDCYSSYYCFCPCYPE